MTKKIYLLLILIVHAYSYAQNSQINSFLINIRNYDFESASRDLKNLTKNETNKQLEKELKLYIKLNKNKGVNNNSQIPKDFITNYDDDYTNIFNKLNAGLYHLYFSQNEDSKVLKNYIIALSIAKRKKNKILLCEIYRRIMEYNKSIFVINDYSYLKYLESYKEVAFDKIEKEICRYYEITIPIKTSKVNLTENQFNTVKDIEKNIEIPFYLCAVKILKGNYYEENEDFNNAYKNYISASNLIKSTRYGYELLSKYHVDLNLGIYYYFTKDYIKSKKIFRQNLEGNGKLIFRKQLYFDFWLSLLYAKTKKWDSAYYYLDKSRTSQFKFNQIKHLAAVNNIQEKYQTAEKEKQILIEQQKKKQNRNVAIGLGVFLLFGSITAFLIQKNTRKKQKLAEQEKALETQKLATVLKEQELVSIDAMIEGQEKERQRIANDLHDDLGGMMATVKLHFTALKDNQTPELFDKTTNLIDEAYQKIRSIAHSKNSGVIAKQGLLKAVQNMADKISISNKIKVDVIDHGLENRLENSLELTIFRIIQELITNVIKHANASESTIHLTNHDDTLNIMIEDNGIGFNQSQITTKNKGMGISSIDKRVEYLNGSMTIESEPKKGTTIIIDIPI